MDWKLTVDKAGWMGRWTRDVPRPSRDLCTDWR